MDSTNNLFNFGVGGALAGQPARAQPTLAPGSIEARVHALPPETLEALARSAKIPTKGGSLKIRLEIVKAIKETKKISEEALALAEADLRGVEEQLLRGRQQEHSASPHLGTRHGLRSHSHSRSRSPSRGASRSPSRSPRRSRSRSSSRSRSPPRRSKEVEDQERGHGRRKRGRSESPVGSGKSRVGSHRRRHKARQPSKGRKKGSSSGSSGSSGSEEDSYESGKDMGPAVGRSWRDRSAWAGSFQVKALLQESSAGRALLDRAQPLLAGLEKAVKEAQGPEKVLLESTRDFIRAAPLVTLCKDAVQAATVIAEVEAGKDPSAVIKKL